MDRSLDQNKPKKKSLCLAKLGIILYTGPIWGVLGTIIGMTRAFSELQTGNEDPAALADEISIAMLSTLIGLVIGIIGAIVLLTVLFRGKSLPLWFFWTTISLSVIWCLFYFPYGAIIGLPTAILFLMRRDHFLR